MQHCSAAGIKQLIIPLRSSGVGNPSQSSGERLVNSPREAKAITRISLPTSRTMLGGEAAEDSGQVTQGNSRETRSGRSTSETISLSVSPEFAREEQSCASKRRYPEDVPGSGADPGAGSGGLRGGKPRWRRPPVCQFFVTSGCKYGDRCRFYHPQSRVRPRATEDRTAGSDTSPRPLTPTSHVTPQTDVTCSNPERESVRDHEKKPASRPPEPSVLDTASYPSLRQPGTRKLPTAHPPTPQGPPTEQRTSVALGGRRRGPSELSLEAFFQGGRVSQPWKPVPRPKPKKGNTAADLRQVELQQLEARFPGNQLVEKGKERVVYRVKMTPTDPEWNFSPKTLDLLVTFPAEYPNEPLSAELPNDQELPQSHVAHGNAAMRDYLSSQAAGQLVFRPFLRWLDGNIRSIFREASREIVVSQLPTQSSTSTESDHTHSDSDHTYSEEDDSSAETEDDSGDADSASQSDGEEAEQAPPPIHPRPLPAKRGTEIRLRGLCLSEGVGTVLCGSVKLVLQCTRCRTHQDVTVRGESPTSRSCVRCYSTFSLTYHPSLLHAGTTTVGFMDLLGCTPVDLVLLDSAVTVTCLECGRDNPTRGFSYGPPEDTWCRRCHTKMSVGAEQCRFVVHQPAAVQVTEGTPTPSLSRPHRNRDPAIQEGKPLPEFGTCLHYKKSHRWLR